MNTKKHLVFPNDASAIFVGLDATPTGSDAANDVVADFTGATAIVTAAQIAGPTPPIVHTPSQTLGSTFKIPSRGLWLVEARVHAVSAAGAVSVRAGLSLDAVVGDLSIDPVVNARTRDVALKTFVAGAGDTTPVLVSMIAAVTAAMAADAALGIVRLLLSNGAGAGAAAATLNLPLAALSFTRLSDLPG
jgi:hypothetical protein